MQSFSVPTLWKTLSKRDYLKPGNYVHGSSRSCMFVNTCALCRLYEQGWKQNSLAKHDLFFYSHKSTLLRRAHSQMAQEHTMLLCLCNTRILYRLRSLYKWRYTVHVVIVRRGHIDVSYIFKTITVQTSRVACNRFSRACILSQVLKPCKVIPKASFPLVIPHHESH